MDNRIIEIPLEEQMDNIRYRWQIIGERFMKYVSLQNELTVSKSIDFSESAIIDHLIITGKENARKFIDLMENLDQTRRGIEEVMRLSEAILKSPNLTEEGKFFAEEMLELRTKKEILYVFDCWESNYNRKEALEGYAKCKEFVGEKIDSNIIDLPSENTQNS